MPATAAKMAPESGNVIQSVKTAPTVSPAESEIAALAYQLWLDNGCPAGSDQEDWFRAEAILESALISQYEDLSKRSSIPRRGPHSESELLVEVIGEGHWEVWEHECRGPCWVSDSVHISFAVSNRAA